MAKKVNQSSKVYFRGHGLVEVTPEFKKAHERECARIRAKMQYHHKCHCPKNRINHCDGICEGCPFRADGRWVSMDTRLPGTEDFSYHDVLASSTYESPEGVLARKTLWSYIDRMFADLSEEERTLLMYRYAQKSEREIAELTGIKRTTLNYRIKKLLKRIQNDFPELEEMLRSVISGR